MYKHGRPGGPVNCAASKRPKCCQSATVTLAMVWKSSRAWGHADPLSLDHSGFNSQWNTNSSEHTGLRCLGIRGAWGSRAIQTRWELRVLATPNLLHPSSSHFEVWCSGNKTPPDPPGSFLLKGLSHCCCLVYEGQQANRVDNICWASGWPVILSLRLTFIKKKRWLIASSLASADGRAVADDVWCDASLPHGGQDLKPSVPCGLHARPNHEGCM